MTSTNLIPWRRSGILIQLLDKNDHENAAPGDFEPPIRNIQQLFDQFSEFDGPAIARINTLKPQFADPLEGDENLKYVTLRSGTVVPFRKKSRR